MESRIPNFQPPQNTSIYSYQYTKGSYNAINDIHFLDSIEGGILNYVKLTINEEEIHIYKRVAHFSSKSVPFSYLTEKTFLPKEYVLDWMRSLGSNESVIEFTNRRLGDRREPFYKVPLQRGDLFVNSNITIQFNSTGAPICAFLDGPSEHPIYNEVEARGWLNYLNLKQPSSFGDHKGYKFNFIGDRNFSMLVTPIFHIVFLFDTPIYGRVYEDDIEYKETTESVLEEEGKVTPPPLPSGKQQYNDMGTGNNAKTAFKSSSPILSAEIGDKCKIRCYNINGGDVEEKEITSTVTTSYYTTKMLCSADQPTYEPQPPQLSQQQPQAPPQPIESLPSNEYTHIRESGAELIRFLNDNFKQIMGSYRWINGHRGIRRDILLNVLGSAITILKGKPDIVYVNSDADSQVCIFGDVHGSYRDLRRFIDLLDMDNPGDRTKLVFLGDYVDRGDNPVESLAYLAALKVLYPDRVTLLMGNHEQSTINNQCNKYFHFYDDFTFIYGVDQEIWNNFWYMMYHLPFAAIIDNQVYCAHGGIPRFWNEEDLRQIIQSLSTGTFRYDAPNNNVGIHNRRCLNDIISSDPYERDITIPPNGYFPPNFYISPRVNEEQYPPNDSYPDYPCGFTKNAVEDFFRITGMKYIVRAHQHSIGHFSIRYDSTVYTVFTSTELIEINGKHAANIVVWNGKNFNNFSLSNDEARKTLIRRK